MKYHYCFGVSLLFFTVFVTDVIINFIVVMSSVISLMLALGLNFIAPLA